MFKIGIPRHNDISTTISLRLFERDQSEKLKSRNVFNLRTSLGLSKSGFEITQYRRRCIHRHVAGNAKPVARMIRPPVNLNMSDETKRTERQKDMGILISHHTGDQLMTFPSQTIELMNKSKLDIETQNM